MNPAGLQIEDARYEHGQGLVELFRRAGSSCCCRFWHFPGGSNAWLDRCANAPEHNEKEMLDELQAGSATMRGVVAVTPSSEVVGWLKLAPCTSMTKLYSRRLYRALPCFAGNRNGVQTIACLLVDPKWRRRGVSRALIGGAVAQAERVGARAIEAFPRRGPAWSDAEQWMGPLPALASAGFVEVHDFRPYPVLRLELRHEG